MNSGDEDCSKIYIPTPNTGSGSNSGAVGGGGREGSSPTGGFNTSVPGYNAPGHAGGGSLGVSIGGSDGHDHSDCYGSNGDYWHRGEDLKPPHKHLGKMANDCPDLVPPAGNIPMIPMPMIKVLSKELALSSNQIIFLRDKPDLMNDINKYLEENNFSEKSKSFARTKINAAIIETKIDDSNLNACEKDVLKSVTNTSVCDIAEVLTRLNSSKSVYNTIIKSAVAPSGAPAQTVKNSAFSYTIYISTDYVGKTKLFIAASIFHEMLHAHFMSIVDDYKLDPTNNQNLYNLNSFPSLFQAYCDKRYPPAKGISSDLHHLEMANYYVDAIAKALQEFQTGIPVKDGDSPLQIFNDLAWGGLIDTPVFDATFPIGNSNRQRIMNRYTSEQNGTSIGAGTPNEQNPIGNLCN